MSETRQIEPELLERLGLVVVRWALIEQYLSQLFMKLAECHEVYGQVITTNVSQNSISGWIRTLLDIQRIPEALENEISELLADIDEMRIERNSLVHGIWGTMGPADSVIVQTVRLDRAAIIHAIVVTSADLDDLIERVCGLYARFDSIFSKIEKVFVDRID